MNFVSVFKLVTHRSMIRSLQRSMQLLMVTLPVLFHVWWHFLCFQACSNFFKHKGTLKRIMRSMMILLISLMDMMMMMMMMMMRRRRRRKLVGKLMIQRRRVQHCYQRSSTNSQALKLKTLSLKNFPVLKVCSIVASDPDQRLLTLYYQGFKLPKQASIFWASRVQASSLKVIREIFIMVDFDVHYFTLFHPLLILNQDDNQKNHCSSKSDLVATPLLEEYGLVFNKH